MITIASASGVSLQTHSQQSEEGSYCVVRHVASSLPDDVCHLALNVVEEDDDAAAWKSEGAYPVGAVAHIHQMASFVLAEEQGQC